jgi:cell division protein FtsB
MEDANYCQARLRAVEVSNAFPIIDRAYKDYQSKQHRMERIFTYTLVLLALLLLAAIFYLRRQMKKLASTRRQLARTNSQLETTNQQLNAANQQLGLANTQLHEVNEGLVRTDQIKEEYIAYYLGRCRNYIDSFNRFRLDMLRLAKNRQTDDLLRSLKSDELFQSQQEQFYVDFDEAFINIHPHFVENFNALLRTDEQIQPKRGELLTTELRIFALIRLGMTDTAEIAHFLNYSLTTIYNYRSRIRNASIYSKEEFEKRLMLL